MSWRRAKTPGWAAVDLKQQQKQDTDNETRSDPYPPISSNVGSWNPHQNSMRNGYLTGRSFSSVLARSASVPNIMANEDTHSPLRVANIQNVPSLMAIQDVSDPVHVGTVMKNGQSEKITARENNVSQLYEKLKERHSWANENLIEDVVAAVNHDSDSASALLTEMAPPGRLKETRCEDNTEEVYLDRSSPANTSRPIGDNLPLGIMVENLLSVPVEPEWEDDDDMYSIHRKEAIRAMRLASRHSKAASEAYQRGDHVAAQEFSQKAREEWSSSEKLNAKAAKEILAIRNCENDDWKLDLHGLHATEAVQVLLEHLLKIESHSTNSEKNKQSSRRRLLEVITGKGKHSRGGEAALPVAIKSFLTEKGYYYYEPRVGVITVQPKFRPVSTTEQ